MSNQLVWVIIAAVAVLLGELFVLYRRDKRAALARYRSLSTVLETAVGPIEYQMAGEGPPILLMHGGAGGGAEQAMLLVDILAPDPYQITCFSRPGYRRTPLQNGRSFEEQADAGAALLDALGLEGVTVLGISAGGPAAIQFALRHSQRCRGLILLSAHGPGTMPHMPPRWLVDLLRVLTAADFITWAYLKMPMRWLLRTEGSPQRLLTPQAVALAAHASKLGFPASDLNAGTFNDVAHIYDCGDWPLESITVPSLIIHGEKDPIVRIEIAQFHAEHIPRSTLITYTDGTHFAFATYHQQVREAIGDFLN